jgi:ATP-dependent Clp protease ATP-binding subunit ClpC
MQPEVFTPEERSVLACTCEEMHRLGRPRMESIYVLLGLVREEIGLAGRVLREIGLTLEQAQEAVSQCTRPDREPPGAGFQPTDRFRQLLHTAAHIANTDGTRPVRTAHLLLGLLWHGGAATEVLRRCRINPEAVRARLRQNMLEFGGQES